MPQTRPVSTSAEDEQKIEQPEQVEATEKETSSSSGAPEQSKENDAAAKARERMERFKALKARAVSLLPRANMTFSSSQLPPFYKSPY
jgi:pre-mRNA-splicing factor SYF2